MNAIIPVARGGGAPGPYLSKKRPLNPGVCTVCDCAGVWAWTGVASAARVKLKSARRFMIVLHFSG
jgi:hypothetical protein